MNKRYRNKAKLKNTKSEALINNVNNYAKLLTEKVGTSTTYVHDYFSAYFKFLDKIGVLDKIPADRLNRNIKNLNILRDEISQGAFAEYHAIDNHISYSKTNIPKAEGVMLHEFAHSTSSSVFFNNVNGSDLINKKQKNCYSWQHLSGFSNTYSTISKPLFKPFIVDKKTYFDKVDKQTEIYSEKHLNLNTKSLINYLFKNIKINSEEAKGNTSIAAWTESLTPKQNMLTIKYDYDIAPSSADREFAAKKELKDMIKTQCNFNKSDFINFLCAEDKFVRIKPSKINFELVKYNKIGKKEERTIIDAFSYNWDYLKSKDQKNEEINKEIKKLMAGRENFTSGNSKCRIEPVIKTYDIVEYTKNPEIVYEEQEDKFLNLNEGTTDFLTYLFVSDYKKEKTFVNSYTYETKNSEMLYKIFGADLFVSYFNNNLDFLSKLDADAEYLKELLANVDTEPTEDMTFEDMLELEQVKIALKLAPFDKEDYLKLTKNINLQSNMAVFSVSDDYECMVNYLVNALEIKVLSSVLKNADQFENGQQVSNAILNSYLDFSKSLYFGYNKDKKCFNHVIESMFNNVIESLNCCCTKLVEIVAANEDKFSEEFADSVYSFGGFEMEDYINIASAMVINNKSAYHYVDVGIKEIDPVELKDNNELILGDYNKENYKNSRLKGRLKKYRFKLEDIFEYDNFANLKDEINESVFLTSKLIRQSEVAAYNQQREEQFELDTKINLYKE